MFFPIGVVATLLGFSNPVVARFKHVAVFSIDGLHGSDVDKYVAQRPHSTIASLLKTGYEYTNALTSAPSDSFPGTLAQFTGAGPRTTGVWYDDTYDRTFFAPSSGCKGSPGAEVVYDETVDFNSTLLFSGGIDPANLPQKIINGKCTDIFPHQRLRVNTVFEVATSHGLETAYADKHPAYDIVRGPSGKGLTEGYFPEINAVPTTVNGTIPYDQLHVNAFLDWIDGVSPANAQGALRKGTTPAIFGGNFQAVSVGQKTLGYVNAPGLPFTAGLLAAIDFVDASLGKVVDKLKTKGIFDDTLIIIASKHGQAPINPTLFAEINPKVITNGTGVNVVHQTSDDIALIFLANHSDTSTAVENLTKIKASAKIQDIIFGQRLIELGFGNPLLDPAVPDIIVRPELGVIYTTSKSKIAEHGGLSDDDRHVACFASNPKLHKRVFSKEASTKQVGPTILKVLGLNPKELKGAVAEGTGVLEGF